LSRRAAPDTSYTSQSTKTCTSASALCKRALLLGGADALRERPSVRVHAAAGLVTLFAVQNRSPELEQAVVRLGRETSEHRPQARIDNVGPERAHIGRAHLLLVGLRLVAVAGGRIELCTVEMRRLRAQLGWKVARVVVSQTVPELHGAQHCITAP